MNKKEMQDRLLDVLEDMGIKVIDTRSQENQEECRKILSGPLLKEYLQHIPTVKYKGADVLVANSNYSEPIPMYNKITYAFRVSVFDSNGDCIFEAVTNDPTDLMYATSNLTKGQYVQVSKVTINDF